MSTLLKEILAAVAGLGATAFIAKLKADLKALEAKVEALVASLKKAV